MIEQLPQTAALIELGRERGLHLGAQLYVSLAGTAVANAALGEARPGEAMSVSHLMIWLSASKPVTAVAIAQLWERDRLDLDDPVVRHIPEFGANGKEQITIRHLLTHTGGIRMPHLGWPQQSWQEIIDKICQAKPEPRWIPGRRAGYHRAASWFVLGEIVQRVSGLAFPHYVRTKIFEPAAMIDSWIGMSAERYVGERSRLAPMHWVENDGTKELDWTESDYLTAPNPGSSGVGPMSQLGRFYEILLAGGGELLRPQTVEALTARHRVGLEDRTFRHVMDWGLGFIPNSAHYGAATVPYGYGRHASSRAYGHSGFRSSVGMADPEHGLVIALGFNGLPDDDIHRERISQALEAIYRDLDLAGESAEET